MTTLILHLHHAASAVELARAHTTDTEDIRDIDNAKRAILRLQARAMLREAGKQSRNDA